MLLGFKVYFVLVSCFFITALSLPAINRVEEQTEVSCDVKEKERQEECPNVNKKAEEDHCITKEEMVSLDRKKWTVLCNGPKFLTFCGCSCFDPSVRIWVEEIRTGKADWIALRDLVNISEQYHIRVLSEGRDVSVSLSFQALSFKITACDSKEVLSFEMTDGSVLKVTAEHPVLLASGTMVEAEKLKVEDKLKNYLGQEIAIKKITNEMSSGEVLNVLVDEEHLKTPHVIVAEGLLVGDAEWQRTLLRDGL